jgi:hypothetical protein
MHANGQNVSLRAHGRIYKEGSICQCKFEYLDAKVGELLALIAKNVF